MRLEWLEDLLTVIETGSFNAAADRRHMTQPAFSRRIKSLEQYVGVELFDRSRKPVLPSPVLLDKRADIQALASGLRSLLHDLRRQERDADNRIVMAAQHSLSSRHAPGIVSRLSMGPRSGVSLRLGSRDECYAMLLGRDADVVLAFVASGIPLGSTGEFCEHVDIGTEVMVPVCAAGQVDTVIAELEQDRITAVSYPPDTFLGRVVTQKVIPMLSPRMSVYNLVESAVTMAVAQFTLEGLGVAWIPSTVIAAELADGSMGDLSAHLPRSNLGIVASRLIGEKSDAEEQAWQSICEYRANA